MLEIKDPAIKIFGKEIQLPADCEVSLIESDDSVSTSDKESGDGALQKVHTVHSIKILYTLFFPISELRYSGMAVAVLTSLYVLQILLFSGF